MPQQIQPSSAPQAADDSNFGGPNAAQMAAATAATKQQPVSTTPNYINAPLDKTGMAVTNPVNSPNNQQPASEPTVLSSGNITDTVIPNNTAALAGLSNKGQYSQDGVVYNSDGTLAPASDADPNAPQQGQIPQGGTDNGDGTYSLNGLTYTNAPDPQTIAINANIAGLKSSLDATTKASIDAIEQQYSQLISQQTSINAQAAGARQAALLTGGTSRYSPDTATGIMQTQLSFGLQQISKLDSDENNAIAQANAANQQGDSALADKLISDAQDLRTQKQTIANQINQALSAANAAKLAATQQSNMDSAIAAQLSQGVTDPAAIIQALGAAGMTVTAKDIADTINNLNPNAAAVNSIMSDAAKNGASPDVLKAIGASTTVAGAIAAAGDAMIDPTSSAGQYAAYVKQAQAAGQTPVSYQTWNDKETASQAYSKAYASAKGDAAGKAAGTPTPVSTTDYTSLTPAAQNTLKTNGFTTFNDDTQNLATQLVTGQIAPAELSKRTTGTSSYNDVLAAADKYSMATTGQHFNISKADIQYKFATNTNTQNTLNYLGSLIGSDDGSGTFVGGNLNQLEEQAKALTSGTVDATKWGHGFGKAETNFPSLNDSIQWARLASGDPEVAAYYATLTETSDQIAKILQGGGNGGTSDAKLAQAQALFQKGFTPSQVVAVADSLKGLLASRATSMVKDNPYLSDYATQFGVTQDTNGNFTTNSQIMADETKAEASVTAFYNSSSQNKALIDAIHAQFPDMSAQEVAQKLNIQ